MYIVSKNETKKTLTQEAISVPAIIVLLYSFLSRTVLLFSSVRLASNPHTLESLNDLIDLYKAWNKPKKPKSGD